MTATIVKKNGLFQLEEEAAAEAEAERIRLEEEAADAEGGCDSVGKQGYYYP